MATWFVQDLPKPTKIFSLTISQQDIDKALSFPYDIGKRPSSYDPFAIALKRTLANAGATENSWASLWAVEKQEKETAECRLCFSADHTPETQEVMHDLYTTGKMNPGTYNLLRRKI